MNAKCNTKWCLVPLRPSLICAALLAATAVPCGLSAGTLIVRKSPLSPVARVIERGMDSYETVGALRVACSSGPAELQGLVLTTMGTGDWASGFDAVDGVTLSLDNGDGVPGAGDQPLWQGPAASPTVQCMFSAPLAMAAGETADIWVILHRNARAGSLLGDTFKVALTSSTHVTSTAATVRVTPQMLELPELRIAEFHVSAVHPLEGWTGTPITLVGFGFKLPIEMTIGPYQCSGTPVVSPDGTHFTGMYPQGLPFIGDNTPRLWPEQVILISSGPVLNYELPFRFTYRLDATSVHQGPQFSGCVHANSTSTVHSSVASVLMVAFLGGVAVRAWHRRRTPSRRATK